jgi:putative N6-adenine-specific DNA methylase
MGKDLQRLRHYFFASCPKGLEGLLVDELNDLGIEKITPESGGVIFETKPHLAFKAILYSRIASRIFMGLFQFDAKKEKDVYFESKKHDWKKEFSLNQTFKINTILGHSPDGKKRSQFTNSMFLGLQLKDAIVDRYRKETNKRPDVDPEDADYALLLHVRPYDNPYSTKELCTVLVDLCGEPLSNRGYRSEKFPAPLRENLAAGMIMLSGLTEKDTFVDAMCGSGTLVTEALLYMGKIPAGYMKVQKFFQSEKNNPWKFLTMNFYTRDQFIQDNFNKVVAQALEDHKQGLEKIRHSEQLFYANDKDPKAIQVTKKHLTRAGLEGIAEITTFDATTMPKPVDGRGVFMVNPPYGERLEPGEEEKLKNLYHELGENLKSNFKDYRAYVLTGNLDKLKSISLRTSKRHILYNGNIECRLAEYLLY